MNYKIKIATTGLLVFLLTSSAFADITDTIYTIEEIQVKANRLEQYLIGSSVQQIDSQTLNNYQSQSLAELLSHQSLVSVKTYGPGGVAGISIRGGGSHHASVIWNGINIQSPMNGEVNFSTLPVSFIDKAYIQFGGATTLFGSGTATGSIFIRITKTILNTKKQLMAHMKNSYMEATINMVLPNQIKLFLAKNL